MAVGSWDPAARDPDITPQTLQRLLTAARIPAEQRFGLEPDEIARLAPLARHPGWADLATTLSDEELVALIRLYTLAEQQLPGWEGGARSPVVPLAAALKRRGRYPADLTAWIKAHSDNRFLPYGDLMSRL